MVLSTAIDPTAGSRAAGLALAFKDFSTGASYLPQHAVLFTTVGTDKVGGFTDFNTGVTVTSLQQFIDTFGVTDGFYAARILQPLNGGGIGSIPLTVFPIPVGSGTAAAGDITPSVSAAATANATHYVTFNGRKEIDGRTAGFVVETGDVVADIVTKMTAAINGMLYAPCSAVDSTTKVTATVRWQGLTGNDVTIAIDTGEEAAGVTYAITQPTGGAGTVSVATALANFGDVWYTQVLNTYGSGQYDALESANGLPDPTSGGSGRWIATVVKPFVAFDGTNEATPATLKALAASRKTDMTNALVPAPNSPSMPCEIAAGAMVRTCKTFNNTPHGSVNNLSLFDVVDPTGNTIGDMNDYATREDLFKNGISTVIWNASEGYKINDLITFRRPDDRSPLAVDWRYVRDIVGIDFNFIYGYKLLEAANLIDKTLVNDDAVIGVTSTIKPKDWKGLLYTYFDSLENLAIIADASFSKESLQAQISATNPQRFETLLYYKRTAIARVVATTAYAGFNFGEQ